MKRRKGLNTRYPGDFQQKLNILILRFIRYTYAMKVLLALLFSFLAQADEVQKIGAPKEVPNFAMIDHKGRFHELRRSHAKAVVLFFTANECPVARQSYSRLRKLNKTFASKGVDFWMIDSNSSDDRESIAKEAMQFNAGHIPILLDETQGVAELLKVNRTGTVVCIETKTWTIFYEGAIDDQVVEGAQKPEPTERYLQTALTQFLAGETISNPKTVARGCLITVENKGPVSYSAQVAPILESKCFGCHSPGNIGSFAMTSYKKVQGMADMIQEVMLAKRMPPWHADPHYGHFQNDASLTPEEAKILLRWVEQGAQRGEGEDPLTKAVAPTANWKLGEPDVIVALPKLQEIPATGILDYRHIKVKAPFDEDVWVKGVVAKPDNNKVVHHIIVRVREPGQKEDSPDDAFLIGWAPGSPEMFYPEGTGKFIKKGSTLDFEMHYTTSGKEETDQSKIGIYLRPDKPQMTYRTAAAYDFDFEISPGDPSEKTFATYSFKKDSMLFDISPHMHLRGSWMKLQALYPNGHHEVLLSVPNYDFNWQRNYRLKEPKRMPAGTWIICSGGFDNSKKNPHNPNPDATITWGDQSLDEMFIGFMGVAEIPSEPKLSSK
jgi:peroxiredoxin